jgi:autotransporter-associated beta strand protein
MTRHNKGGKRGLARLRRFGRRLLLEAMEPRALLATFTWTGTVDGSWSDPGNWVLTSGTDNGSDAIPSQGDSARFATTVGATNIVLDVAGATELSSLEIDASNTSNFNFTANLGNSLTVSSQVAVAGSGYTDLHIPLAGTAVINKGGTGELTLSAANTVSGTTTITNGTLTLSGGAALADTNSVSVQSPGVLKLAASESLAAISGTGTVELTGATNLTLLGGSQTLDSKLTGPGSLTYAPNLGSNQSLSLTNDNDFSGGITGNDFALFKIGHERALGTGTLQLGNAVSPSDPSETPGLGFVFTDGSSHTIANNIVLGTSNFLFGFVGVDANADNVQVTLSGTLSGGAAASAYRFSSDQNGNFTNTIALTGNNTFQGKVEIGFTTLAINADAALGNSDNDLFNQTKSSTGILGGLRFDSALTLNANRSITLVGVGTQHAPFNTNGNNVTIAGDISGTAARLTKNGSGTLTLSGNNTYFGKTIINAGTLCIDREDRLGSAPATDTSDQLTLNGGTLKTTDSFALDDPHRGVSLGASGGTFDVVSGTTLTLALAGGVDISGVGALSKAGDGTLQLINNNSYTGMTAVNQGTVQVGNGGNQGTVGTGNVAIAAAATLRYERDASAVPIANPFSGNGTLLFVTGDFNLTGVGSSINTLNVAAGTIVDSSSAITVSGTYFQGERQYQVISGQLGVNGTNLQTDAALSSSTAQVALVPTSAPAPFNAAGTTWSITGNTTLDLAQVSALTLGNVTVANSSNVVWNVPSDVAYQGVITGGGGLSKLGAGTLTLNTVQTYSGGTTLENGTLKIGGNDTLPLSSALTVGTATTNATFDLNGFNQELTGLTLGSGASTAQTIGNSSLTSDSTLTLNIAGTNTFDGVIRDTLGAGTQRVALTKNGAGTLVLPGANTYSGNTDVNAGTLTINGSLTNSAITLAANAQLAGAGTIGQTVVSTGGKVLPGNPLGILQTGSFALDGSSTFVWEFQTPFTTAGTDYDQLQVTGTVTLDNAILSLSSLSFSDSPPVNQQFTIIANDGADVVVGTFAGLAAGSTILNPQGYRFVVSYTGGDGNDVTLQALSRIPLVVDDNYSVTEDTVLNVSAATGLLANDVNFSGVTTEWVTSPAPEHGTVTIQPDGSFQYTPHADYQGTDTFTYRAKNSTNVYSPTNAVVHLTIVNAPDPPTITSNGGGANANLNQAENITTVTTVVATDIDPGDTLTYSIHPSSGADRALFAIHPNSGALSFLAAPNFESPQDSDLNNEYEVVVVATDALGNTDSQILSITITNANDDPVFTTAAAQSLAENVGFIDLNASDEDSPSQAFVFSIIGGADEARFAIVAATGVLSFVAPAGDFEVPTDADNDNVYEVNVQVSDGLGGLNTRLFSLTVTPVDDNQPVITSANSVVTPENFATAHDVNATDADVPAQALTYAITGGSDATKFQIDTNTGVMSFVTLPDFEAPDDFNHDGVYNVVVEVSDGSGPTTSQSISISLSGVNDNSPVFTSAATATVAENTSVALDVNGTDGDLPSQSLSYSINGGNDAGRFTIHSGTGVLSWLSNPNFEQPTDTDANNTYEVTVRLDDGQGFTADQSIQITVSDANDPPVITSDGGGSTATVSMPENSTLATNVTVTNEEGGLVSYRIIGGADATKFSVSSFGGSLTFKSSPNFEAPTDADGNNVYEVIVEVKDFESPSAVDTQTINVTVTNVALVTTRIFIDPSNGLIVSDLGSKNDNLIVSKSGNYLVLTDNTTNVDQTFGLEGITGGLGSGTKTVSIPFTTISATAKPMIFNFGIGADTIGFDTDGQLSDVIPSFGLTLNMGGGSGVDTFELLDNTSKNTWTIGNTQSGNVVVGALGTIYFTGAENLRGGTGEDAFTINNTNANGITLLDGNTGSLLDSVTVTRDANYVLSDTKLVIDNTVDQTFGLSNIQRAFLTGGAGNNTFDISSWTKRGANLSGTSFGGKLVGQGGFDTVVKKQELTSFTLADAKLETNDNMIMVLSVIQNASLEDTNASTPSTFNVSNWNFGASLKAPTHVNNTLLVNGNFTSLLLTDTSLKLNNSPLITLNGIQTATIIGGSASQAATFHNFSWTGTTSFDGGAGSDTVLRTRNANFIINNSFIAAGTHTVTLANVETYDVKGGTGNNQFDIRDWSNGGKIDALEGTGDKVLAAEDANLTLAVNSLVIGTGSTAKTILHFGVEAFSLTGGASNNTITLNDWNGNTTIDGAAGNDTLVLTGDRNYTLANHSVSVATGGVNTHTSIESLTVTGGGNSNTFTLQSGFHEDVTTLALNPAGGNDTLVIADDADITATQTGTTTLNVQIVPVVGTPRTLNFTGTQFPEVLQLTGGDSNNNLIFNNYSGFGAVDGGGGSDTLKYVRNANFTLVTITEPVISTTLQVDSKTYSVTNIESMELTGGSSNNSFTVTGWTNALSLSGGDGVDKASITTKSTNVVLTPTQIQLAGANSINLLSLEDMQFTGTDAQQSFDVSAWSGNGTMNGQSGIDRIILAKNEDMLLLDSRLEYGTGTTKKTWSLSNVERATLTGGTSNNFINAFSFSGATIIDGGSGNDIIYGGKSFDELTGGDGHDWVFGYESDDFISGGAGNDILIGGNGNDSMNPNAGDGLGEDILIGGFTLYDTNRLAIDAFMAAWSSSNPFVTRVQLLNGTGVGANNAYKLQIREPSSPATVITTVFDDEIADTLLGVEGLDWFFAEIDAGGKEVGLTPPRIDYISGEILTDLG